VGEEPREKVISEVIGGTTVPKPDRLNPHLGKPIMQQSSLCNCPLRGVADVPYDFFVEVYYEEIPTEAPVPWQLGRFYSLWMRSYEFLPTGTNKSCHANSTKKKIGGAHRETSREEKTLHKTVKLDLPKEEEKKESPGKEGVRVCRRRRKERGFLSVERGGGGQTKVSVKKAPRIQNGSFSSSSLQNLNGSAQPPKQREAKFPDRRTNGFTNKALLR